MQSPAASSAPRPARSAATARTTSCGRTSRISRCRFCTNRRCISAAPTRWSDPTASRPSRRATSSASTCTRSPNGSRATPRHDEVKRKQLRFGRGRGTSRQTSAFRVVLGNARSQLAEALHSSADCANQLLLLLGLKRSRRAPTLEYPLGFGKEIYFWSFIVAIMLFSLGGLFSIYEGWHKLSGDEGLEQPLIAIAVL